jgi:hypothetical protein
VASGFLITWVTVTTSRIAYASCKGGRSSYLCNPCIPAHVLFSALSITKDESFFLWQINRLRYAVPDLSHWLAGGKKARCGEKAVVRAPGLPENQRSRPPVSPLIPRSSRNYIKAAQPLLSLCIQSISQHYSDQLLSSLAATFLSIL